jgi:hypothetical protein
MITFVLFLALGLLVYWRPIVKPHLINLDDNQLYGPLEKIRDLKNYLELRQSGLVEDLQPVRDFSFYLEWRLKSWLDYFNPQLDNLIIWVFTVLILNKILKMSSIGKRFALFVSLLILVHPVAVNSVAWPSARKHLLSALFILWATQRTLRALKDGKTRWSPLLFHSLAVMSQPINVLWGVWYLWVSRQKIWSDRKSLKQIANIGVLALIALTTVILNFYYYQQGAYVKLAGQSKFQTESWDRFGDRLLATGRYIYQLVWPVSPSYGPYFLGSFSSLCGFGLLLALLVFGFVKKPKYLLSHWLLFMILPLLVVIFPTTEHAGWDTYLLTPLLGFGLYLGDLSNRKFSWFEKLQWRRRGVAISFFALFSVFAYISHEAADAWSDELTFWQRAYDTDPGALQTSGLLKVHYVTDKDPAEILRLTNLLLKNYPKHRDLAYLLGRMIYERPLPENVKEELFAKNKLNSIWYIYYEAAFEASRKNFAKSENLLREGLFSGAFDSIYELGENLPEFAAGWYFACEKSSLADCDPKLEELKSKNLAYFWNQEKFERRLQSFRAH